MQALAPKAALSLLSASIPASKQEGLKVLRDVLWRDNQLVEHFSFIRMTRKQYLNEALSYLTILQQVRFMALCALPHTNLVVGLYAAIMEVYSILCTLCLAQVTLVQSCCTW